MAAIIGGDNSLTIAVNGFMSVLAFAVCLHVIPRFREMFIKANLFGIDLNKAGSKEKVPEALGVVCGAVFLCTMVLFMPVRFYGELADVATPAAPGKFPHNEYTHYLAALLSISCMIFLGFADDVLDLRWRHKMLLPIFAAVPLLIVYFINIQSTTVVVPVQLRPWLGLDQVNVGPLYYLYMGALAVFCTNAINIHSGVNGLEVGQSCVIAVSVLVYNFLEIHFHYREGQVFSVYFMMPFLAVSLALLAHNWYPSRVFVGDTYCYFAGMTFAVVAILSHFSKTMLLFFIPQVANFLFSVPQLFHLVPCPRHRLPRLDPAGDKLTPSCTTFKTGSLGPLGRLSVSLFATLGAVRVRTGLGEGGAYTEVTNMTLNNLLLKLCGPMHERRLVMLQLAIQGLGSCVAFIIRYQISKLFYY